MRLGHWDAGFGIAGDMALGSLLDAGAHLDAVNAALSALGVPGLRVETQRVSRCGLDCIRASVRWHSEDADPTPAAVTEPASERGSAALEGSAVPARAPTHQHDHASHPAGHAHDHSTGSGPHHTHDRAEAPPHHPHGHTHRAYRDIRDLLAASALPAGVRERAEAVFARLAEAEGRIHGRPPAEVHFHEVGGQDALGDIVGIAAALDDLGVSALTVSALPAGGGTVSAAHGLLPVPAPAVALLLEGFDVDPGPVAAELVTPTGAAILAALARPAGTWPSCRLAGSGWGAGRRDFPGHPNACRFVWGERAAAPEILSETLVEMETNVDDQTPELVGHLYERLFAAGALDVATSPLWMKKQRQGVRIWALVRPGDADLAARCLFEESSALGLRVREVRRWSLPRTVETVQTRFGPVGVKVARMGERVVNAAPEYEDCRTAATRHGVALKTVFAAALAAWDDRQVGGRTS